MSNVIIVEGKTDEQFIDYLIKDKINNKASIKIRQMGGFDNLVGFFQNAKLDKYDKVGIILDANSVGVDEKIDYINTTLNLEITKINTFYQKDDLNIACYITNVDGKGELETLLRAIKSQESKHADCLNEWKSCCNKDNIDKLWLDFYLRYDIFTKTQREKFAKSLKALNYGKYFNLDDSKLNELKKFLNLFV